MISETLLMNKATYVSIDASRAWLCRNIIKSIYILFTD